MATQQLEQKLVGLIEWAPFGSVTAGEGSVPVGTGPGDEEVQVLEQYGFASGPPSDAVGLVFAPGGELTDRVALGVSSVAGRPATDAGDSAQWTAAGHQILLDDDGDLTITSKDGSSVVFASTGEITLTAGTGANITLNVETLQSVNLGGAMAVTLTKWLALSSAMTALLNAGAAFVGVAADPAGANASGAFAAALAAWDIALGLLSPETDKAKGE